MTRIHGLSKKAHLRYLSQFRSWWKVLPW